VPPSVQPDALRQGQDHVINAMADMDLLLIVQGNVERVIQTVLMAVTAQEQVTVMAVVNQLTTDMTATLEDASPPQLSVLHTVHSDVLHPERDHVTSVMADMDSPQTVLENVERVIQTVLMAVRAQEQITVMAVVDQLTTDMTATLEDVLSPALLTVGRAVGHQVQGHVTTVTTDLDSRRTVHENVEPVIATVPMVVQVLVHTNVMEAVSLLPFNMTLQVAHANWSPPRGRCARHIVVGDVTRRGQGHATNVIMGLGLLTPPHGDVKRVHPTVRRVVT